MSIGVKLFLVACLSLSIVGCAQHAEFGKIGASKKFVKRDSEKCWNQAQKVVASGSDIATSTAINLVIGGPAQMVGHLIGQAIAADDPKNARRRVSHDACMKKKGYKTN